ncbi:hypothetical protein [Flagellimonas amoyensis]|uniref:hypothetical protein n=1 Tax=Flagellimonas amoyensis TaxID=2169401 RepID=UPI000D390DCA|nr:hypothetical protein [Allomuricauda amoyensis]
MKKTLFLLFIAILAFSCSNDDDNAPPPEPPIPVELRYLSTVKNKNGETVLSIEYNENKRIKKFMAYGGDYINRYEYDENGRINTVFLTLNGISYETAYSYDEDGTMNGYRFDNEDYPVAYDAADNSYSFVSPSNIINKIYLDQYNNCDKMVIDFPDSTDSSSYYLFYEQNHKGPLYNGGDMGLTNIIGPLNGYNYSVFNFQLLLNVFSLPIEEVLTDIGSMTFDNGYDEDSFLTKTTQTNVVPDTENGGSQTIVSEYTYHYIQL